MRDYKYNPDHLSPPGDSLRDILEEEAVYNFHCKSGLPLDVLKDIISGRQELTPDIIKTLSIFTETDPKYWKNREDEYRKRLKLMEIKI